MTCDWDTTGYRLPTEAEWEKAARGGLVRKKFANGDFLGKKDAHFGCTSEVGTLDVGQYPVNGYGLYDVDGNVWEWCWDWYQPSYKAAGIDDPRGPERGDEKVFRGGCWMMLAISVGMRFKMRPRMLVDPSTDDWIVVIPENRRGVVGFRWVRAAIL